MANTDALTQATQQDIPQLAAFLEKAEFVHRHLDWHTIFDWVNFHPFLILKTENEIQAVLVVPPDPPQMAWVHCFASRRSNILDASWKTLFTEAHTILQGHARSIYAVGLEDWFVNLLTNNQFNAFQKIVVLSWNHHLEKRSAAPKGLFIRPMLENDLDAVVELDSLSFEPQWINTRGTLTPAYLQSHHSSVAELDGKIVGYQLTTSNQYSAHLARLAVLPEYRHSFIGESLVYDMLQYFSNRGAMSLTVNTQDNNIASLHLYQKMGFELTGEEYPVLQL
jgi:[ribosomal protein S18]-alanine N-acetyltransferase